MSASVAFTTLTTTALPVRVSVACVPSRVFTPSVLPSTFSMVPRRRVVCGCCAQADVTTTDVTTTDVTTTDEADTAIRAAKVVLAKVRDAMLMVSSDIFSFDQQRA